MMWSVPLWQVTKLLEERLLGVHKKNSLHAHFFWLCLRMVYSAQLSSSLTTTMCYHGVGVCMWWSCFLSGMDILFAWASCVSPLLPSKKCNINLYEVVNFDMSPWKWDFSLIKLRIHLQLSFLSTWTSFACMGSPRCIEFNPCYASLFLGLDTLQTPTLP